ncbi:hydantoinase B/oxoprolinase family protein [Halorientalis sp.]|uniref:hydantoinase B/oxoprolinase family protein n=1 Tax=Halorientalis sp. TaxID=1931229 RepID=UPI0026034FDE|nr:hydantoinase B/oxoprolinase family protein [Halorientalis sp.]
MATSQSSSQIEPYLMTILSKKFESATRDMTQSLLKSARSGVVNVARDFSSAISLFDGRQFMVREGLPVHTGNIGLTPEHTVDLHDDISPGDCFLTNSPYYGNSHHADYTLHVPVFYDGEPLFWSINRAHQADIGASIPSTYLAHAEDVYQEAMHFPSVRIQEDYESKDDIVRMLKLNIRRGEDQWYGDYLAQVSAVRTGEEKVQEICEEYGVDVIKNFIDAWLNYGEEMMAAEISKLPEDDISYTSYHDPVPDVTEDRIPVNVTVRIDPNEPNIVVDLTDNIDNLPFGLNLCEATAKAAALAGIFNNIDSNIPINEGSLSCIDFQLADGCIVGNPEFPVGTAAATTNIADVLLNAVQAAFGQLGEPWGIAEGNPSQNPCLPVISGTDFRHDDEQYVNQMFHIGGGGPGLAGHDGWLTYAVPNAGGALYRDSIEIDEQKFPIYIKRQELIADTGGAGKWRGAPATEVEYGPREDTMEVAYFGNAKENPPKGILGGKPGAPSKATKITEDGATEDLPILTMDVIPIEPNETIVGRWAGGGGYGNPYERDPDRVRKDVKEGVVSIEQAAQDYGVVVEETGNGLEIDQEATANRRGKTEAEQ